MSWRDRSGSQAPGLFWGGSEVKAGLGWPGAPQEEAGGAVRERLTGLHYCYGDQPKPEKRLRIFAKKKIYIFFSVEIQKTVFKHFMSVSSVFQATGCRLGKEHMRDMIILHKSIRMQL